MKKNTPPQQPSGIPEDDKSTGIELHIPVLLEDTVRLLAPQAGERYLDLTAGYGGHATKIADVVGYSKVTLVDRDQNAIAALRPLAEKGASLVRSDFYTAATQLVEAHEQFDMVLLDLGVSSPQLDTATRGFSFQKDGPLDMRMDESQQKTAADIVNRMPLKELLEILETYGEERPGNARAIVTAIAKARPITTTAQLAAAVLSTHRGPHQRVHPATRTFQAIRIALNDELGQLARTLPLLPRLLRPAGRMAIISFHSLEDRLVKQFLAEQAHAGFEAELELLTKKAILGNTHDVHNPRARSAVLRAAVKK